MKSLRQSLREWRGKRWYESELLGIGSVRDELLTTHSDKVIRIENWFLGAVKDAIREARKKFHLPETWNP